MSTTNSTTEDINKKMEDASTSSENKTTVNNEPENKKEFTKEELEFQKQFEKQTAAVEKKTDEETEKHFESEAKVSKLQEKLKALDKEKSKIEKEILDERGHDLQEKKLFPGPEDYGSGAAIMDMIKTTIQDWPLKLNLLRLMYITNIKNFVSEFWNLPNDDDKDLTGMSQRVKDSLRKKTKYIDDYVMEGLNKALENTNKETRVKIKTLFKNISITNWPIVNTYYFYANIASLIGLQKMFAAKGSYDTKDSKLMDNIMSMKDSITKKAKEAAIGIKKTSTNAVAKAKNVVNEKIGGNRKHKKTRRKRKQKRTRKKKQKNRRRRTKNSKNKQNTQKRTK